MLRSAGDDGLVERLGASAPEASACLRWIDPYGNTIFNRAQASALAAELDARRSDALDCIVSLEDLIELARECAEGVHLYVWCIGD